ncbi:MAG: S8 family serine peptidase [Vicingaceae bacterium]
MKIHLLLFLSVLICGVYVSNGQSKNAVLDGTNVLTLKELALEWANEERISKERADRQAIKMGLPLKQVSENGEVMELIGVDKRGLLRYYMTENRDAARTISTDKVWPGGSLGFSLKGDSMSVGEWDGGAVRTSHQELTGRVTQVDGATSIIDHATHVAGTLIGAGVDSSARGMAYAANLNAYDWNSDNSEMASAAANGMLVSNHSYGSITGWRYNSGSSRWEWWGDTTLSASEDYKFGYYSSSSQAWDLIARNAPYYLIVKSAGNDRGDIGTATHYLPLHAAWSSNSRPADGGSSGYDCISTYSGSKNILTVGAVNAIPSGYSSPSGVVMSSFSGWGPTDDGRIKPDIVANGVGVYSSLATSNSAYASWNGTSMSSPTVTGSLVLIQQAYNNENASYLKAASLKALTIHTADEAGSAPGPDYIFGWGLMNTAMAVEHIADTTGNKDIIEASLSNGQTYSFNINVSGTSPIKATLCWTDVPGTPPSQVLNSTATMLVNDLDIRIVRNSDSTVYSPYILNPSSPSSAATTGDNFRDNVEQVFILNPSSGSYTVSITNKGTLSGGSSQAFSLVLDGGSAPAQPLVCNFMVDSFPDIQDFESFTNCSSTSSAMCPLPPGSKWANDSLDDIDWKIYSSSTPSSNTGPTGDFSTENGSGKYAYLEASTSGTGFPGKIGILYPPCYNLDTLTNAELFFAYHMYGSAMGSLSVEIYNGFGWTSLWSRTGNQGNSWNTASVDLSAYDGDTVQIRFVGITGSNFTSDMALDGIEIREYLPCPNPTNVSIYAIGDSSASAAWSSNASFWRLRLNLAADSSLLLAGTINFNPVSISGLLPNTSYDLFIQDSCGGGDTSEWIGPYRFTTTGPLSNPSECGLNLPIADNTCPGVDAYRIDVSTVPGSQMGNDVYLKEVNLIIDHTYDSDLFIALESPWNDTVVLSAFNGSSGDNFGNPLDSSCSQYTSFTMAASTAIGSGSAPFIGAYLPEDSLTDFNNGNSPIGLWRLLICDNFASDIGNVQFVELIFDSIYCVPPTFSITNLGSDTICQGNNTILSAPGGNAYQWLMDGQPMSGSVFDTLQVFQTGTYNVLLTDSNSCTDTASGPIDVFTAPNPSVSLSNSGTSNCDGDTAFVWTSTGFSQYQWYKDGQIISSSNSWIHEVDSAGSFNVLVTNSYACSDSAVAGVQFSFNSLPTVNLTSAGSLGICLGDSVVLSASGGSSFQWMKDGNPISGSVDSNFVAFNSGSYNALVTNSNNCSDSSFSALTVQVNNLPTVSMTANGPLSFCAGNNVLLSTSAGTAWQWYKDGTAISSSTSSSFIANTSGNYNVLVTDSNSCSDSASSALAVNVFNLPVVSLTASGPTTFCDGDSVGLFTSVGTGWQWYRDGQVLVSAISMNYNVKQSGQYNVMVTDSNNCSDSASSAVSVTVNPLPVVVILASGPTTFCRGDSVTLTSVQGSSWQWYRNGQLVTNANAIDLQVGNAGNYNVVITDANNCSDSSSSSNSVVVNELPMVSLDSIPEFCDISPAYQLIQGMPSGSGGVYSGTGVNFTTAYFFDPSMAGPGNHDIWYRYTNANMCADSANQTVVVGSCVGIEETGLAPDMFIFPNPSKGLISIQLEHVQGSFNLSVFDAGGQIVSIHNGEISMSNQLISLDLSHVAKGIYFLQLQVPDHFWTQKLILE